MHGFVAFRRREDAIASQIIMSQRLDKIKTSYFNILHDVANAFGSTSQPALLSAYKLMLKEQDFIYYEQRLANTVAEIRSPDGIVSFFPRSGAPQGSCEGPAGFLYVFRELLQDWTLDMREHSRHVTVVCAIFGVPVDGSVNTFADDIYRKLLVDLKGFVDSRCKEHMVDEAFELIEAENKLLDERLLEGGFVQNLTKQEIVQKFRSRAIGRRFAMDARVAGRVRPAARHLGTHFVMSGAVAFERRLRLRALSRGWWSLGRVWTAPLPRTLRRMMFVATVQGEAHSVLEAVPWSRSDCHVIDVALCKRIRVFFQGEACDKTTEGEVEVLYKAMSNFQVLKRFRVCPTVLKLAVRRAGWLRGMVAQPAHHSHVIALIWGKAKFEQHDTIDAHGFLTQQANGMAVQLQHDMDLLRSLREEETFFEEWGRHDYSWRALFHDELVKEFMKMDFQVFRAVFYTDNAPGVVRALEKFKVVDDGADEMDLIDRPYACSLECEDSTICGARFVTKCSLRMHQTHTLGGQHGERSVFYSGIVTNECPWCRSSFASREGASKHSRNAHNVGHCALDQASFPWAVVEPSSLSCPLCDEQPFVSRDLLQRHLVQEHFPPAPDLFWAPASEHADHAPADGILERLRSWWRRRRPLAAEAQEGVGRRRDDRGWGRAGQEGEGPRQGVAEGRRVEAGARREPGEVAGDLGEVGPAVAAGSQDHDGHLDGGCGRQARLGREPGHAYAGEDLRRKGAVGGRRGEGGDGAAADLGVRVAADSAGRARRDGRSEDARGLEEHRGAVREHDDGGADGGGRRLHQRQVLRRRAPEVVAAAHPEGLEGGHRAGARADRRSSEARTPAGRRS